MNSAAGIGATGEKLLGQKAAHRPALHHAAPGEGMDLIEPRSVKAGIGSDRAADGRAIGGEVIEPRPAAHVLQLIPCGNARGQARPHLALEEGGPLVGEADPGRVSGG